MDPLTRRQFVKECSTTFSTLAGTSLLSSGLFLPVNAFAGKAQPVFEESVCGNNGKQILVAYESYCGTTSRVAVEIADELCRKGLKVDVRKISNIDDITAYSGVVVGSAVRSASWYPDAIDFVKRHQDGLSQIPVAYFLTCLALYYDTSEAKAAADSYFQPVLDAAPRVRPLTRQAFAGVLDYGKLNAVVRMVMKSKMKKKGIPEGDHRDFNKVRTWAKGQVVPMMAGVVNG